MSAYHDTDLQSVCIVGGTTGGICSPISSFAQFAHKIITDVLKLAQI